MSIIEVMNMFSLAFLIRRTSVIADSKTGKRNRVLDIALFRTGTNKFLKWSNGLDIPAAYTHFGHNNGIYAHRFLCT